MGVRGWSGGSRRPAGLGWEGTRGMGFGFGFGFLSFWPLAYEQGQGQEREL